MGKNIVYVYVPKQVKESYDSDSEESRKELQKQLKATIAAKYNLKINESRVTSKEA